MENDALWGSTGSLDGSVDGSPAGSVAGSVDASVAGSVVGSVVGSLGRLPVSEAVSSGELVSVVFSWQASRA